MIYRFIRLKWRSADDMSEVLNAALERDETVVSISALADEVLVLVRYK